jgi:hypothetical protein
MLHLVILGSNVMQKDNIIIIIESEIDTKHI